ncbi:hypothetical protein ACRALDRAFT_1062176 [Sodiomyces alcalophilus JCM 7366]|uniref:uncharacterized protein n=1 Tax=Sodiomyces alcalophilus JCM 7366 TaxID=591952 RepID=UPI0039B3C998
MVDITSHDDPRRGKGAKGPQTCLYQGISRLPDRALLIKYVVNNIYHESIPPANKISGM